MKKFTIKKFLLILCFLLISILVFLYYKSCKFNLLVTFGKNYLNTKDFAIETFNNKSNDEYYDANILKDVVYKVRDNKSLSLDIYKPLKNLKKHSPVILYVHGGSWAFGDKAVPKSMLKLFNLFRESGYTIISTTYELMKDKVNFYNQVSDVKDTIRWIHKNKDFYNLNSNEIGVLGISSGAHLSLLASYSDNAMFTDDKELKNYPSSVKYLIDLFGPTDLNTLDMSKADKSFSNIIRKTKDNEAFLNKFSPINYVNKNIPNTLIIHSKEDTLVPFSNAQKLYDECLKYKKDSILVTLNDSTHDLSYISDKDISSLGGNILKFIFKNTNL